MLTSAIRVKTGTKSLGRKQLGCSSDSSNTNVEVTIDRLAGGFVISAVEDAAHRLAVFALCNQADKPRSYLQLALQGEL